MTNLDPRSMIALAGFMSAVMAMVLLFMRRHYPPSIRGVGGWAAAPLLWLLSAVLFGARGAIPDWLGLVLANQLLVLGSDWLVGAAVVFAKALGVSDLVIGLTIVAAGTSMPEVATSVAAALKGERDIAVGNVVGSSTFNILGCLGLAGLVAGSEGLSVAPSLMAFDIWVMLAVALACLPIFLSGREIARWEGAVFLGYYAAYVSYLILAAQQHDALHTYSAVMLGFVIPLTVVTLVVSLIRPSRGVQ